MEFRNERRSVLLPERDHHWREKDETRGELRMSKMADVNE